MTGLEIPGAVVAYLMVTGGVKHGVRSLRHIGHAVVSAFDGRGKDALAHLGNSVLHPVVALGEEMALATTEVAVGCGMRTTQPLSGLSGLQERLITSERSYGAGKLLRACHALEWDETSERLASQLVDDLLNRAKETPAKEASAKVNLSEEEKVKVFDGTAAHLGLASDVLPTDEKLNAINAGLHSVV